MTPTARPAQPALPGWVHIIGSVKGVPGLFALIVLSIGSMLGAALTRGAPGTLTIIVMAIVMGLAIVCVTLIIIVRPSLIPVARPSSARGLILRPREQRLPDEAKEQLVQQNRPFVKDAEMPPLSPDDQTRKLRQLRSVIYQAPMYSTPTYFLDAHLAVIHWNVAFELIFRSVLPKIRGCHVNCLIAELANSSAVFDHARTFTKESARGQLPLVDCEPLVYESQDYGRVEFEKIAVQLTDDNANLRAWSVALLLKRIDWDMYVKDLEQRSRDDKLWSIYAVSYDAVLSGFPPYQELVQEVLRGIPRDPCQVLELGAGTGNVTKALLARGHRVTAVENNTFMLEKLYEKQLLQTGRLSLVPESLENTEYGRPQTFDAAVAVNVAYALDDPSACFRKVAEVLKPGGSFVLSTTHSETDLEPLLKKIEDNLKAKGEFEQKEEHFRWVVKINRGIAYKMARRHSREQYQKWLEEVGFKVVYNEPSYLNAVAVIHARKI
ncbi:MAG TPA: class I SAM-dependent methyltransferase [Bryobacteraceae bacterium]|nr:class I SAM-dependent methyltransferase [Bryobacteraceae bacterium]